MILNIILDLYLEIPLNSTHWTFKLNTVWRSAHLCPLVVWQVAIVQFSDDARTEFKLNSYNDKERLLDAINKISYKGGNTKTGESTADSMRRSLNRPWCVLLNSPQHRNDCVQVLWLQLIKSSCPEEITSESKEDACVRPISQNFLIT